MVAALYDGEEKLGMVAVVVAVRGGGGGVLHSALNWAARTMLWSRALELGHGGFHGCSALERSSARKKRLWQHDVHTDARRSRARVQGDRGVS
jgi:hypothetical protein